MELDEKQAAEMVKRAIDMAIPGARVFVTPEHCAKVARVIYSSNYKFVYDPPKPIPTGGPARAV